MKEWKKQKEYDGTNSYTLIFGHHLNKPKNILCLFRGEMTDDWYTTSSVLRTNWTWSEYYNESAGRRIWKPAKEFLPAVQSMCCRNRAGIR